MGSEVGMDGFPATTYPRKGVAPAGTGAGAGRIVTSGTGVRSNCGVSGTSAVREDFVEAGTLSPSLFTATLREPPIDPRG
eukprot:938306-Heterocapsa_arctica.AAC.1